MSTSQTPFWDWFHKTKTWPDVAFTFVIMVALVAALWIFATH